MPSPIFLASLDQQFLSDHSHLVEQSRQLAQAYEDKQVVIEDETLQRIGASLWQALDCETDFLNQEQASGQYVLNIVIESNEPKILNLAWETLHHPEFGFLGRSNRFTLSRRLLMEITPKLTAVECTPLRILLFASMPADMEDHGRLQVEEEKAHILQAISPLEDQGLVELIAPDDGRFDSFKQAIQEHQPHLVYLSGHCSFHHNTFDNAHEGWFLFEDAHANSLEVSEHDVVECFNNTQVQAIVLSSGESGKFDARDLNNSLSIRLAKKGIPHIIGMRGPILDSAGIEFSVTFLEQIASKKSISSALQAARSAIKSHVTGYAFRGGQQSTPILSTMSTQQWCLPSLLSQDILQPLVDWSFTPTLKEYKLSFNYSLDNISLPEQFLGRKRELYQLFQPLLNGTQKQLLLTAAGGMGKTALAGQLCQQLKDKGFEVFAYSAREGNQWSDFIIELEFALEDVHANQYDARKVRMNDQQKVKTLFRYLLAQHEGRVVLFLDNLESIQDLQSSDLTDNDVQSGITEAQALSEKGLRLILTSRWRLPSWKGKHHNLEKPAFSDFIAFARQKGLLTVLSRLNRSREVYDVLGGNFRAFEFFVKASKGMNLTEADEFLAVLDNAKNESQKNMTLDQVLSQKSTLKKTLLTRFPPIFPHAWASEWGQDQYGLWQAFTYQDIRYAFRWIPPGKFITGSPKDEKGRRNNEAEHQVTITEGFWFGEITVTQKLWVVVMGRESPSYFKGDELPVESITWDNCQDFISKVQDLHPDLQVRLPLETEWEYACRAGTTTSFSFGQTDDLNLEQINYSGKWDKSESRGTTKPVKSYPPNNWGLYEMHGNVFEWCQNTWSQRLGKLVAVNLDIQTKGGEYVVRGGAWHSRGMSCRSAARSRHKPEYRDGNLGLRLVLGG